MQYQRFALRRCRRQRTEVIAGWAQATINNKNIRLLAALTQNGHQVVEVIANGITSGKR